MPYSIFDQTIVDLTYPQVEAAARRRTPIIIPISVIEQHGPHLPLGTDVYGAHVMACLTKSELYRRGVEILIAPPFYWGINAVNAAYPGSMHTRPETTRNLLTDLCTSLAETGLDRQYVVNHHGDQAHLATIYATLRELRGSGHTSLHWVERQVTAQRLGVDPNDPLWVIPPMAEQFRGRQWATTCLYPSDDVLNIHATGSETALIARYFSGLARFDELERLSPVAGTAPELAEWRKGGDATRQIAPEGYFGDPWPADVAVWQFYEHTAGDLAQAIHDHLKTSAPPGTGKESP